MLSVSHGSSGIGHVGSDAHAYPFSLTDAHRHKTGGGRGDFCQRCMLWQVVLEEMLPATHVLAEPDDETTMGSYPDTSQQAGGPAATTATAFSTAGLVDYRDAVRAMLRETV